MKTPITTYLVSFSPLFRSLLLGYRERRIKGIVLPVLSWSRLRWPSPHDALLRVEYIQRGFIPSGGEYPGELCLYEIHAT